MIQIAGIKTYTRKKYIKFAIFGKIDAKIKRISPTIIVVILLKKDVDKDERHADYSGPKKSQGNKVVTNPVAFNGHICNARDEEQVDKN